jgi:hypothetical protein
MNYSDLTWPYIIVRAKEEWRGCGQDLGGLIAN